MKGMTSGREDVDGSAMNANRAKRSDWPVYLAARAVIASIGRIPPLLAYGICEICALFIYLIDRKHRRIGLINLRIAFPNQDEAWRKRTLRSSFRCLADHFVELCRLPRLSAEEIRRRVTYEPGRGIEHYKEAKRRGKGVMFLTGHFGAWEILPLAHAILGHPLNVVVRPLDNPLLDRWMTRTRSRFGNKVIGKESSLRRLLRLFGQGEDVGLLIDQNVQEKDGVYAPLFGHLACTAAGPVALALRTGTPIVFAFLFPAKKRRHYVIRFYPVTDVEASNDRDADLRRYTTLFNRYLEEVVRSKPDCWLWGHRRFGTQPDGSDPYG